MWQINNRTPFSTQGYFMRDRQGGEHWCLAVRARFQVRNDGLVGIAEKQSPIRLVAHYADTGYEEMVEPADFAPFRSGTDILWQGVAQAPEGKAFQMQPVELSVGKLKKSAMALCTRRIKKQADQWKFVDQKPALKVPLSWRHALGGQDVFAPSPQAVHCQENPIGKGWSQHIVNAPDGAEIDLPQLERLNAPYHPERPMPSPVGFGPMPPSWAERLRLAGSYEADWSNIQAPLPPPDFQEIFHHCAPTDQISAQELRGGEPVTIDGLHGQGAYQFRLPQLILEAKTWMGRMMVTTRFRLITLILDGTAKHIDMIWNSALACPHSDHLIDRSQIIVRQMTGVVR